MEPSGVTRKPRANMPNHASTQRIPIKGDPKNARKRVANQRNIATIMPAPETLQEFPRQEAAKDAAQRDNKKCTHHDSRNQNINSSRPTEPTRGRLQWRKKDNETKHRRGCQTSQCHQARDHPHRCRVSLGRQRPGTYPQPKNPRIEDKLLTKTTCVEQNGFPS